MQLLVVKTSRTSTLLQRTLNRYLEDLNSAYGLCLSMLVTFPETTEQELASCGMKAAGCMALGWCCVLKHPSVSRHAPHVNLSNKLRVSKLSTSQPIPLSTDHSIFCITLIRAQITCNSAPELLLMACLLAAPSFHPVVDP